MELSKSDFIRLYESNLIPLRVVLAALVWVLHDYFITLEDEVVYIWSQKRSLGKFMFLWVHWCISLSKTITVEAMLAHQVRYYTIFLVAFDTLQIHTFAIPGVATDKLCVAADPVTRLAGAISLWSVEIIMQLRIYALFNRSKPVAVFNALLFLASIGIFLWIMIVNAMKRGKAISQALHLPLPGCPVINGGTEWSLWIAPTVFEFILFLFVVYKSLVSVSARIRLNQRVSLTAVLLQENMLYFFSVACLLIFNNLMVVGATHIPWFGFGDRDRNMPHADPSS
ncbi:unnamed protein product [Cyclocybe aegerita]|uniref:DUF6533 domain-containing protein n=1 Tax=Cyclocybe aegerita TaxID=1973307 RepID=A0A8S0XZH1_CYCAE|nr:unnamed protein product [Cyclocybe aegerita]